MALNPEQRAVNRVKEHSQSRQIPCPMSLGFRLCHSDVLIETCLSVWVNYCKRWSGIKINMGENSSQNYLPALFCGWMLPPPSYHRDIPQLGNIKFLIYHSYKQELMVLIKISLSHSVSLISYSNSIQVNKWHFCYLHLTLESWIHTGIKLTLTF